MTLVIVGTLQFDPDQRDAVLAAAVAMQQATRQEPGCLHYVFSADLEAQDLMHVAEKWVSQTDLDAHFAAPHMADFLAATRPANLKGISAVKYEVASEGPVR